MKPLALLVLLAVSSASAAIDWPVLQFTEVATGAANPVYITSARDGTNRLFLVQKGGLIRIFDGTGGFLATPFLGIASRISTLGERGLLSVAFPPDYSTAVSKHFYVYYSRAADGAEVISRFKLTANANVADAASEEILLVIDHPDHSNHNGGQLQFGADGFLYIGVGDGGGAGDQNNNAQNPRSLLGKMLRIDVEDGSSPYSIPEDNPFLDYPRFESTGEIWARGYRNPWRFSFDRLTGAMYVGDVGQDKYEEIDFEPAGAGGRNYGWRLREGRHNYNNPSNRVAGLTGPVAEYDHTLGAAVTGGYVYRGPDSPRLNGIYIYGDFESGRIWGMIRKNGLWRRHLLTDTSFNISTFGEDESGQLYLTDYSEGKIYLIEDATP